jgi:hypothetical protein
VTSALRAMTTHEDGSGMQVQSEEHFLKDQGDSVPGF